MGRAPSVLLVQTNYQVGDKAQNTLEGKTLTGWVFCDTGETLPPGAASHACPDSR